MTVKTAAILNYSFSASTKQITLSDYQTLRLEYLRLIVNITTGTIIYKWNDAALLATVSANVITLVLNTSAMSNTDQLMIIYDDPTVVTNNSIQDLLTIIIKKLDVQNIILSQGLNVKIELDLYQT